MRGVAVLAVKSQEGHRLVLMREYITKAHYPDAFYPDVSPFGLPLRIDNPNVDPVEWEDEDDD